MRIPCCVLAGAALVAAGVATPEPAAAAASDGPDVQSIARKSVRRAARKPVPEPAAEEAAPLPRPKGMTAEEAAATFAPGGQVTAVGSPNPAAVPAAVATKSEPTPDLPKDPGTARTQLRSYYAVSVLADRCSFPVTTREGHLLDRIVSALEHQLKLNDQQADALYSDVDLTLYSRGGSKLCLTEGDQARSFRATLDKLLTGQ